MNKKYPFALVINDSHLHKNNVELVKSVFKQSIELCEKLKIDKIFHNGDFFHSREAQPLEVLLKAKEIFLMIKNSEIELFIIPGNHDKTSLDDKESYLDIFHHQHHCNLIKEEYSIDFKEINVIWLPYFKEKGSYLQRLENASKMIIKGKFNLLNTHIGINGVNNNDGSAVENEVKQELFKKFSKIFVAHYHDQQSINNIFYTGGMFQQNFGEDELKGFTILYSDGSHEFVQSKFPKFIKEKINIDDKDALKKFEKKYANSTDHIRAILIGEKTKLQSFKKENFIDKGIDCKFESEEINTNVVDGGEINIYNRSNISKAFDSFCELNSVEDKEFGKRYLEKIL